MRTFLSARLRAALSAATLVAVASTSTITPAQAQAPAPATVLTAPSMDKQQETMLFASIGAIIAAIAAITFLTSSTSGTQSSAPNSDDTAKSSHTDGTHRHVEQDTATGVTRSAQNSDSRHDNRSEDTTDIAPRSGGSRLIDPKEPGQPEDDGENNEYPDSKPLEHGGPYSVNSARDAIYTAINEHRAKVGLPALKRSSELEESANGSAEYMKQTTRALGESKVDLGYFSDALSTWPSTLSDPNAIVPAQILWSSTYNLAPSLFIPSLINGNNAVARSVITPAAGDADTTFTDVGVGVTRDPSTGRWFFVLRFTAPKKVKYSARPLV